MTLRALLVAIPIAVPAAAQVAQVTDACPRAAGVSYDLGVATPPQAGATLQLDTVASLLGGAVVTPPTSLGVLMLSVTDPSITLPSCGCEVIASRDVVLVQPTTMTVTPIPGTTNVALTSTDAWFLPLPAAASGRFFHAQACCLLPAATSYGPGGLRPCDELQTDLWFSQWLEITVP